MPGLTKDQWYNLFYTPENEKVLKMIRKVFCGEMRIVIDHKRAVKIYPAPVIDLSDPNKMKLREKFGKEPKEYRELEK